MLYRALSEQPSAEVTGIVPTGIRQSDPATPACRAGARANKDMCLYAVATDGSAG